jgi:predicted HicB family RNase H-like nuclease
MSSLIDKGFAARIEFDPDDPNFVGRLADTNDVISFQAETTNERVAAFYEAVDVAVRLTNLPSSSAAHYESIRMVNSAPCPFKLESWSVQTL